MAAKGQELRSTRLILARAIRWAPNTLSPEFTTVVSHQILSNASFKNEWEWKEANIFLYSSNCGQQWMENKTLQPNREAFYAQSYIHEESTLSIPFKKTIISLQALVPRVWEECGFQYRHAHGLCHVLRTPPIRAPSSRACRITGNYSASQRKG